MTWGKKISIVALLPMSLCIMIGIMCIVLGCTAGWQWEAILFGVTLLAASSRGEFLLLRRLRMI